MRILITGASGFVGGHMVDGLSDHEIVAWGYRNVPEGFARVDLRDLRSIETAFEEAAPDAVIHSAVFGSVAQSEKDPTAAYTVNVTATEKLMNLCSGIPVIFFSTDLVFDGRGGAPAGGFKESDSPTPGSVYSRTKLEGERVVSAAGGAVLRLSLVYGSPVRGVSGALGWTVEGLRSGRVTLFSDEYRTPIWVGDIVRAVRKLLEMPKPGEFYHFGGPDRLSRVEFGELICQALSLDKKAIVPQLRAEVAPERADDVSLCTAKFTCDFGFQFTPTKEALRQVAVTFLL